MERDFSHYAILTCPPKTVQPVSREIPDRMGVTRRMRMKQKRFTEEQIVQVLREVEAGGKVGLMTKLNLHLRTSPSSSRVPHAG